MLSAEEKIAIVNYRRQKSHESLNEAKEVIKLGFWSLAGNRLYYAAFHMASALLLDKGITARSHSGVIHLIGAQFVTKGLLEKEYTKLELTEKLTILFSTLIMILVLIILGMVALFYLLFALAYILEPLVGGLMSSFAIIAGINVVLIALVIIFRKQLIISPMVNFLANLFLTDSNK